jgi:tRNA A-37 threonylcarbamoyl transferase component Bud32
MQILLTTPFLSDQAIHSLPPRLPLLARDGSTTLNHRKGQQTFTAVVDGQPLIVKRYIGARRWPARLRPLFFTRAWRSSSAGRRLLAAGVRVPRFLLLVADDHDVYAISERLEAIELYAVLRDDNLYDRHRTNLCRGLKDLLASLHAARATHGDLHARNILVDEKGGLWLIDLDHVRFHRFESTYHHRRMREETRLGGSLKVRPALRTEVGFIAKGESWCWTA